MGDGIRRFRDSDAASLAALTVAAIRTIGPRGYSAAQVAAWAARHPGPERFIASAAKGDAILVAVDADDRPLAYVLTESDGHVDMLYCHPDHSGNGAASMLLGLAEAEARKAGVAALFTEASELARPVFARAGYSLLHRRDFTIVHASADVAIHNYAMEKQLR
ncbi:MAG: GNAT family N-acetyltransferase [Erythrobacter sp.]